MIHKKEMIDKDLQKIMDQISEEKESESFGVFPLSEQTKNTGTCMCLYMFISWTYGVTQGSYVWENWHSKPNVKVHDFRYL